MINHIESKTIHEIPLIANFTGIYKNAIYPTYSNFIHQYKQRSITEQRGDIIIKLQETAIPYHDSRQPHSNTHAHNECHIFSFFTNLSSVHPDNFTFSASHMPRANSHRYCKKKLPHGLYSSYPNYPTKDGYRELINSTSKHPRIRMSLL